MRKVRTLAGCTSLHPAPKEPLLCLTRALSPFAGVVQAAQRVGLKKPVVLRLQGTNVDQAREFIDNSGYKIISVDDLDKAANTVVNVAKIKKAAEEISLNVSFELPM